MAPTSEPTATTAPVAFAITSEQAAALRQLAVSQGMTPITKPTVRPELMRLGQAVAFDKISAASIDDITAFLTALTDPRARDLTRFIPHALPSGLPVDRLTLGGRRSGMSPSLRSG